MWCLLFGDQKRKKKKKPPGFPLAIWPRRAHTVTGPLTCFQLSVDGARWTEAHRDVRFRPEEGRREGSREINVVFWMWRGVVSGRWLVRVCPRLKACRGPSLKTPFLPPSCIHNQWKLKRREWMNSQTPSHPFLFGAATGGQELNYSSPLQ